MLLYTDGVTEASAGDGAEFGEERLRTAIRELRHSPARTTVESIVQRVDAFASGAPQADDITCLALIYAPAVKASPVSPRLR